MIRKLLGSQPARRPRLSFGPSTEPVYAIGDVHGCLDLLQRLERLIIKDAARFEGPKRIFMLGDYIDRGPASSQVLEHLAAKPPEGFSRVCLAGNHEVAMLDFLEGRIPLQHWLAFGGDATLASYNVDVDRLRTAYPSEAKLSRFLRTRIPEKHVEFLRRLPVLIDTPHAIFVHAGLRPGLPLERQADEDLVSIRSEFLNSTRPPPKLVVHGHTPTDRITVRNNCINLDTGAVFTGRLSAACLSNGHVRFTST